MAKNRNDYFAMIQKQVEYCVKASDFLGKVLRDFSVQNIHILRGEMHEIEHEADEMHHEILVKLSAEFITPIDQEDILRLVQVIDDITDELDKVVLELYMYNIKEITEYMIELSELVSPCVNTLMSAIKEFRNFKKPESLHALLVEVNTIEGKSDAIYVEAVHNLFVGSTDNKSLIGYKAIYKSLENCCDLCEHAADIIEQIVIKNT